MKRLLPALLALALVLPPAAPSGAHIASQPFTPELRVALKIAYRFWGRPPLCTSVYKRIVNMGDETLGEASVPKERQRCVLLISHYALYPEFWVEFCATMIHEVGHLNGREHNDNPRSIMFREIRFAPGVCTPSGHRERLP